MEAAIAVVPAKRFSIRKVTDDGSLFTVRANTPTFVFKD